MMPDPTEQEIMERAFHIWERSGKREGRENKFWYQAERELRNSEADNALIPEPLT